MAMIYEPGLASFEKLLRDESPTVFAHTLEVVLDPPLAVQTQSPWSKARKEVFTRGTLCYDRNSVSDVWMLRVSPHNGAKALRIPAGWSTHIPLEEWDCFRRSVHAMHATTLASSPLLSYLQHVKEEAQ